jgi:transposase
MSTGCIAKAATSLCFRSSRLERPCRATPAFIAQMKQAVQTNPLALGYGFSTWLATRSAQHLAKVTGIRFSDDQLRRLLHQEGFSIHRPKHTLKGKRNEQAYKKAA